MFAGPGLTVESTRPSVLFPINLIIYRLELVENIIKEYQKQTNNNFDLIKKTR